MRACAGRWPRPPTRATEALERSKMKGIDSINDGVALRIARFDPAQSLALLASCIGVPSFPATSSAQRSAHSCSGARAVSKSCPVLVKPYHPSAVRWTSCASWRSLSRWLKTLGDMSSHRPCRARKPSCSPRSSHKMRKIHRRPRRSRTCTGYLDYPF